MASSCIKKENASDIANKYLDNCPNLKTFLQILMKDIDIETKEVGQKFHYRQSVVKNKLFPSYGIVMDYFIRKLLANKFSLKLEDDFTELVLNNPSTYFTSQVKAKILPSDIEKHYKIFKDSNSQAINILESIKKVSLSTTLYFRDPLPRADIDVDHTNLFAIIKYFEGLPYTKAEIKPNVGCNYFEGNADIIFNQNVLYEIKTSQYPSLSRSNQKIEKKCFFKFILYAFGYYKTTGKIIKKFKIYNPLLGQEHKIRINDIDMRHFEEVLKMDVRNLKVFSYKK